ncbi:hypothetical protein M1446_05215 [Candidatus Dependentiae bacterium]|nr:hypothetical protein [Candidatus Dependentiae bacterium]
MKILFSLILLFTLNCFAMEEKVQQDKASQDVNKKDADLSLMSADQKARKAALTVLWANKMGLKFSELDTITGLPKKDGQDKNFSWDNLPKKGFVIFFDND